MKTLGSFTPNNRQLPIIKEPSYNPSTFIIETTKSADAMNLLISEMGDSDPYMEKIRTAEAVGTFETVEMQRAIEMSITCSKD